MRVCSYSLSDIMHMAILSSVLERNTAIGTVLAENDTEPEQLVCFNSVGQRLYVRRNRVGDI